MTSYMQADPWESNLQIEEDTKLASTAARAGALRCVPAGEHMVSLLHDSHTTRRETHLDGWTVCEYPSWTD